MDKVIPFSIILPAYNEEKRLPDCMKKVSQFVESHDFPIEVLLVENGSKDRTYDIACKYAAAYSWLKVFHEEKAGKGNAVRRGMLEAKGRFRMFADVDFSMPIEDIERFIPPQLDNYDIAIASREVPGAVRYNEPKRRRLTGRIFNLIVQLLVAPGIHDTQCGFKAFRDEIAEAIFPVQQTEGWAFDAELICIARTKGYKILEIPIHCYYDGNSKVNIINDSLTMFKELLQIRKNMRSGVYDATGENNFFQRK